MEGLLGSNVGLHSVQASIGLGSLNSIALYVILSLFTVQSHLDSKSSISMFSDVVASDDTIDLLRQINIICFICSPGATN